MKAVFDTNLWVGWLRNRAHEELIRTRALERYLSAVVWMELTAGATTPTGQRDVSGLAQLHQKFDRIVVPLPGTFERAGRVLRLLRSVGQDVRRASFVNDVLIAMSARQIGATVFTSDRDFEAIREADDFSLEVVG